MGVEVEPDYGGTGASFFSTILVVEEISKVDPSLGILVDLQNTLINSLIIKLGTPEQKKEYLSRLAADTVILFLPLQKCRYECTCCMYTGDVFCFWSG